MSAYEPPQSWHVKIFEGPPSRLAGVWEGYWPSIPPVGAAVSPLGLARLEITEVLIPLTHDPRAEAIVHVYVTDSRRAPAKNPAPAP